MRAGNKPKVEILLATFNGEKYIVEQLDSILNQTYRNIKITIHDDGSSDRTLEILRDYSKRYPEIINLIDDGISTGSAVRNFEFLLKNSSEEYIMFADQDDVWLPNKIELTLNKMLEIESKYGKDTPLLVYTDVKVVDEDLNILSESLWDYTKVDGRNRTFSRCLETAVGLGFTMMINKRSKELSLPFPQNVIMHDHWVSLVVSAFGEIEYIDITTGLYRQHRKNVAGVQKFGIGTLKEKILRFQEELSRFKEDLKVRQNQARDFFEMYGNSLPNNLKEIILFYINAQKTNRFVRIFKVLKFGLLWFKSPLRNLGKLFLRWFLL
jgi:glycosyltransferase involved in cell wall biosynthesis